MKRLQKYLSLALPTLLLLASEASADSILVVNCETVSGPTELTSAAITCGQFNLAGQTLSDIEIVVSGGITGSITLTNGASSPQKGSGTTTTDFTFDLAGFSPVDPVFSASFGTGLQPVTAGQTLTFSGLSGSGSGSLGHNTTVFAPYTGNNFFNILVSTSTLFSGGGTGGFFSTAQETSANATAVVTFTYDTTPVSVPEPATVSLLALGLLGLGVRSRRFRATQ